VLENGISGSLSAFPRSDVCAVSDPDQCWSTTGRRDFLTHPSQASITTTAPPGTALAGNLRRKTSGNAKADMYVVVLSVAFYSSGKNGQYFTFDGTGSDVTDGADVKQCRNNDEIWAGDVRVWQQYEEMVDLQKESSGNAHGR
jgi:hypothetical protein